MPNSLEPMPIYREAIHYIDLFMLSFLLITPHLISFKTNYQQTSINTSNFYMNTSKLMILYIFSLPNK